MSSNLDIESVYHYIIPLIENSNRDKSKAMNSITQERLSKVSEILNDMPPESIVINATKLAIIQSFLLEKQTCFHVADRIKSKAQGLTPKWEVPNNITDLVKALALFYEAYYSLVYECWEYLEKFAVDNNILPKGSEPKDAFKIILNENFIQAFDELSNDNREFINQVRSKHDKADRRLKSINKAIEGNLKPAQISMLYREWEKELITCSTLSQELLRITAKHAKKPGSIQTASKMFQLAISSKVQAETTYFRGMYK